MSTLSENILALSKIVAELEAQAADFPAALEAEREAGRRERDADVEAAKIAGYDEGFAAGVASVPVSDKVFSQAEVDAMLAPLNEQVLTMQGRIAELEGVVAGIDQKVSDAVALALSEFKAILAAEYEARQVAETEIETGFKELLK